MVDAADALRRLVGENIRKARHLRELTQQDAASSVGLNFRYYQEIERGLRNPTLDVLFAIANVLKVSAADLVDVDGQPRLQKPLMDTTTEAPKRGRKRTKPLKKPSA